MQEAFISSPFDFGLAIQKIKMLIREVLGRRIRPIKILPKSTKWSVMPPGRLQLLSAFLCSSGVMAATEVSKTSAARREGSSPSLSTIPKYAGCQSISQVATAAPLIGTRESPVCLRCAEPSRGIGDSVGPSR